MTLKDLISGESEFIEFKQEVPKKSEVYMKTVVAFANGSGGKIVFGVEDGTCKVVGINQEDTYIRVSGTTRPADSFVLKELEFEGVNRCFDQTYAAPEESVTEDEINCLCNKMYQYAVEHCRSEETAERIHRLTKQRLLSWGFLVKRGDDYFPTNAFCL
ncbi:MAG: ATP-binding protein [Lachnospiraceae bacterium]|nr:ATP-binding protein [Lachnospiraceae bacterium]